jgi:hypothetical protein
MKSSLKRVITEIRVWLGWGDMSEERVSPPHGWLLPKPTTLHSIRVRNALEPPTARLDDRPRPLE